MVNIVAQLNLVQELALEKLESVFGPLDASSLPFTAAIHVRRTDMNNFVSAQPIEKYMFVVEELFKVINASSVKYLLSTHL